MKKIASIAVMSIALGCSGVKNMKSTNNSDVKSIDNQWVLTKLGNQQMNADNPPTLWINLSKNHFSGFAGCNRMGGKITNEKGKIHFGDIFSTKMYCENMEIEDKYLDALEKVTSFKVEGDKLFLSDENNNVILNFVKAK